LALTTAAADTSRSLQKQIGASDIGFCRAKAKFIVTETEPTDEHDLWAAQVGLAIHEYMAKMLSPIFPAWHQEALTVVATLPSGAEIQGHPDVVIPEWNMVLDYKTVDGFAKIRRYGVTLNHQYQRHLYALGCLQAGLLTLDRPLMVGNVYLDRSGGESRPLVRMTTFDEMLTSEIDEWVQDVIYAVKFDEEASRDIPAPVCEAISCEFFTACRGGLPMAETELITEPVLIQAIDLYVAGREQKDEGLRMMSEAKRDLAGVDGHDGRFQVRHTKVDAADVPGYSRAPYEKIDVRKMRK
jgi:hypothetical protein